MQIRHWRGQDSKLRHRLMLRMHALLFPQQKFFKNHSLLHKIPLYRQTLLDSTLANIIPTPQSLPCISMAKPLSLTVLSLLLTHLFLLALAKPHTSFAKRLDPARLGLMKEKLTHFRVYWHDILSGPRPTSVPVVPPLNTSTTGFGTISMIDDALTVAPRLNSKIVGRAQGFYALTSQSEVGLLMAMNFAFMEGKYNGSTISILGRNTVFSKVREMPIIGGSGLFRFARGYVQARTHSFDVKNGDATVEYNVYVLHY